MSTATTDRPPAVARPFVVSANEATVSLPTMPNLSIPPYGGNLQERVTRCLGQLGWTVVRFDRDQGCAVPTRSIHWPAR